MLRRCDFAQPITRRRERARVAVVVAREHVHQAQLEQLARQLRDLSTSNETGRVHLDHGAGVPPPCDLVCRAAPVALRMREDGHDSRAADAIELVATLFWNSREWELH